MRGNLLTTVALAALISGCGEKPAVNPDPAPPAASSTAPAPRQPAAEPAAAALSEADTAALLDTLTQTLRKFSAEKQRVPKSLDELVSANYLPAIPVAPAGKKFTINPQRVEVILADN